MYSWRIDNEFPSKNWRRLSNSHSDTGLLIGLIDAIRVAVSQWQDLV